MHSRSVLGVHWSKSIDLLKRKFNAWISGRLQLERLTFNFEFPLDFFSHGCGTCLRQLLKRNHVALDREFAARRSKPLIGSHYFLRALLYRLVLVPGISPDISADKSHVSSINNHHPFDVGIPLLASRKRRGHIPVCAIKFWIGRQHARAQHCDESKRTDKHLHIPHAPSDFS